MVRLGRFHSLHHVLVTSNPLQVRVPLDKFLGAVILEAHGELSFLVFAFDADDRASAVGSMADAHAH